MFASAAGEPGSTADTRAPSCCGAKSTPTLPMSLPSVLLTTGISTETVLPGGSVALAAPSDQTWPGS